MKPNALMLFFLVSVGMSSATFAEVVIGSDGGSGDTLTKTALWGSDGRVRKVGSNEVTVSRNAGVSNSLEIVSGTVRLERSLLSSATYWLDAADSQTVTTNGAGGATKWTSVLNRNVQFESNGTAPGYTNSVNGLKVLSFTNDGTNYNRFHCTDALSQRTVYLCLAPNKPEWVTTGSYYLSAWGWYGKGQIEHSLRYSSYKSVWESSVFASAIRQNGGSPSTFTPCGTWQILGVFNEHEDVTDQHYSTFPVGIGGYETWGAAKNFNGDIAEVIAFDRVLDDDECAEVENHLAAKWGLQDVVWHSGVEPDPRPCEPTVDVFVHTGAVLDLAGGNVRVAALTCDGLLTNSSDRVATLVVDGPVFCRGTVSPNVTVVSDTGMSFWSKWEDGKDGSDYFLRSISREDFNLYARRVDKSVATSYCLAIGTFNQTMWTHNKLVMYVRSMNGKSVSVHPTVSHLTNGETVMVNAETVVVSGRTWRKLVLGLDSDFGLGDRSVDIRQVKIGAWIDNWNEGDVGGIEVKGLRFCAADEVADSSVWREGDSFVSVPARPLTPFPADADALKVYFAFDNEDVIDSVDMHRGNAPDPQQYGGFRETLLAELDGRATYVTNLVEADVIVYSRARSDANQAAAIAAAVGRGVPLYAASEVCDPEIEAILPCRIGHDILQDFPPRFPVLATAEAPSSLTEGLTDAAFGVYRSCVANDDARTLLRFSDGTPALVEGRSGSGKVLYNMVCIGSSLVPGKESPDAFFVRALSYLTGRELPERPRAVASADEWHEGIGSDCFGRFGWEVGSGLLVGALGSRLTVSANDASYEFSVPRTGTAARRVTFAGDRAQALSLGGEVSVDGTSAFRLDASLGYPGIRWDIHCREIELHLANIQGFLYIPTSGGGRTVELSDVAQIDLADLSEPWVLLYNGSETDSPLMLALQHRPAAVSVLRSETAVDGLRLVAGGDSIGAVIPTWINGARTVDTSDWSASVPSSVLACARLWCARAMAYPVVCRERFRIDEPSGRVVIRDDFTFVETENDWNLPPAFYAPVSPVAWMLHDVTPQSGGGVIARFGDEVATTGLSTRFGDLAVVAGATDVTWSLPLFKPTLGFLPHVQGYADLERIADECFSAGVQFAWGGGVKLDQAKDKAKPYQINQNYNYNMHSALLGLLRCTENPFIYSPENRALMRRRFVWRMMEPLESLQYKMTCRWRREPVSGVKYTIYMNSSRDISTVYDPPEYGTGVIYGDSNETVRMILAAVQRAADRMGQTGLVKANWDVLSRQVPSFVFANDDWLYLASGCLEYGGSSCIDMLNSEFGCMMSLARLAEIAGDAEMQAQALYRAARRLSPTLARFGMRDYFTNNGLAVNADTLPSTGYNESGAFFEAVGKIPSENYFFDMSQGIPRDLIGLYDWYGYGMLRTAYLPRVHALTGTGGDLTYCLVSHLAIGGEYDADDLLAKLRDVANNTAYLDKLKKDWPGMDVGAYMEYSLQKIASAPRITDCRDVCLHDATYNPKRKRLVLDVTPGVNAVLAVEGQPVEGLMPGCRTTCILHPFGKRGITVVVRGRD